MDYEERTSFRRYLLLTGAALAAATVVATIFVPQFRTTATAYVVGHAQKEQCTDRGFPGDIQSDRTGKPEIYACVWIGIGDNWYGTVFVPSAYQSQRARPGHAPSVLNGWFGIVACRRLDAEWFWCSAT